MKISHLIGTGTILLLILLSGCAGDEEKADIGQLPLDMDNYDQVQDAVNEMEKNERYQQATEFMQDKFDKFPENEYEIIKYQDREI